MKALKDNLAKIAVLVALAAVLLAAYFYAQARELKTDPNRANQEEVQQLVVKVGKLILLPEGEDPTVATVADPAQLKSQPFFANAKQGDKVLIYTNARKAILYSPSENKIVEVAPINIGDNAPASAGIEETASEE